MASGARRSKDDAGAIPDRPYAAVHDSGEAGTTTHVLERNPDGSFSGRSLCSIEPDGWIWSFSGRVTCRRCRSAEGRRGKEDEEEDDDEEEGAHA